MLEGAFLIERELNRHNRSDNPGGALHIFRVRGRAIGKGIYFPDIGIKNGINFHNVGIRNGIYFQDFYMKCIRSDILSRKIGIRSGILFQKIGIRNGYVFKASMARPLPKSGQVHPPGAMNASALNTALRFGKVDQNQGVFHIFHCASYCFFYHFAVYGVLFFFSRCERSTLILNVDTSSAFRP